MPPVGFEPTISAGERLQTYALNRAATGTGVNYTCRTEIQYDKERDWKLRTGLLFYKLFVLIESTSG